MNSAVQNSDSAFMHIVVIGVGATGARVVRQLAFSQQVERLTLVDTNSDRAKEVFESLADNGKTKVSIAAPNSWGATDVDVVVLAGGQGAHLLGAKAALDLDAQVVSLCDDPSEVADLSLMDEAFRSKGLTMVVGAGFSPGLSCVLASHAAKRFDRVDEVHIAHVGTGGKACKQRVYAAMKHRATEWTDGAWAIYNAGSGQELCWFPDPVGARDCYRGDLVEPLLLKPVFREATRITSRIAPLPRRLGIRSLIGKRAGVDDEPGAIRVEVRGFKDSKHQIVVLGAIDRPSVGAGSVAALSAVWAGEGNLGDTGVKGLAGVVESTSFLKELANQGVKAAIFTGNESSDKEIK